LETSYTKRPLTGSQWANHIGISVKNRPFISKTVFADGSDRHADWKDTE